jgi:hypothetical protein
MFKRFNFRVGTVPLAPNRALQAAELVVFPVAIPLIIFHFLSNAFLLPLYLLPVQMKMFCFSSCTVRKVVVLFRDIFLNFHSCPENLFEK